MTGTLYVASFAGNIFCMTVFEKKTVGNEMRENALFAFIINELAKICGRYKNK